MAKTENSTSEKTVNTISKEVSPRTPEKPIVGIVMPISAIDGCSDAHWAEVLEIVTTSIEEAGFNANLVSNAEDVGIIQKRIIQNLYDNPIVVCDVSGKNPNVMFELGLRLAFDKPTIIIKDDKTSYSFDTSPIEHLEYPRDLRFTRIVDFKIKLAEKIKATHERATNDHAYTTFLKNFGEFKVAKLDKKEVTGQEFIIDELRNLRGAIRRLERPLINRGRPNLIDYMESDNTVDYCLRGVKVQDIDKVVLQLSDLPGVLDVKIRELDAEHNHLIVALSEKCDRDGIKDTVNHLLPRTSRPLRSVVRDDEKG